MAKGTDFDSDIVTVPQTMSDNVASDLRSEHSMDLDCEFRSLSLNDFCDNSTTQYFSSEPSWEMDRFESGVELDSPSRNRLDHWCGTQRLTTNRMEQEVSRSHRPEVYSHVLPPDMQFRTPSYNNDLGPNSPRFVSDEGYNSMSGRTSVKDTFTNNGQNVPKIKFDAMEVFVQDSDGDTALHNGIIQRTDSLVFLFISVAPDSKCLNIRNSLHQSPLHLAVITRQVDIVRRLMVAGASVDMRDIHGNTPLHVACREGFLEIVEMLLQPVHYEETRCSVKYQVPFQRIPQDLEQRNYAGFTCLHLAAQSTFLDVMELLLARRADINAGDGCSGRTVLHYGAEIGNRILVEFLLKQRHLDICSQTYGGLTPLRLASGRCFPDIVGVLLSHGADLNDSDSSDEDIREEHKTVKSFRGV